MPDRPGSRPARTRRPAPGRRPGRGGRPTPSPGGGPETLRERLRRDHFLFLLCLVSLGFLTAACAMVWLVFGGLVPLALAVASVGPAIYLIYLRDA